MDSLVYIHCVHHLGFIMPAIRKIGAGKVARQRNFAENPYSLNRSQTGQSSSSATTRRTDSFTMRDGVSRSRSTSPSSVASSSDLSAARDVSPPAGMLPLSTQNREKSPFSRAASSELSLAPSGLIEAKSQPQRGRARKKQMRPRHAGQFKATGVSSVDQEAAITWFDSLKGSQKELAKQNPKFPDNPSITWNMAKKFKTVLQPKRSHSPRSKRRAAQEYVDHLSQGVMKNSMPANFTLANGAQVKKSTVEKWKEILVNEEAFEPAVNQARLLLEAHPWESVEKMDFTVWKTKRSHVYTKKPKQRSNELVKKTYTGSTVLNNWMPFFHKQQLPTIESMKVATRDYATLREVGMQQPDLYARPFNVTLEDGSQKTVLGDIVQRWKGIFQTHTD
jgi:hypothetical protein